MKNIFRIFIILLTTLTISLCASCNGILVEYSITYYVNGEEVLHLYDMDVCCGPRNHFLGKEVFSYYALPSVVQYYDLKNDEALCLPDKSNDTSGEMHRVFLEAMTQWTPTYPDQMDSFLAVATPEETMLLSVCEPIFQKLSQELFMDLLLGNISMDNWDDCIRRLNEEGYMAQIQAVYQARYARYLGE